MDNARVTRQYRQPDGVPVRLVDPRERERAVRPVRIDPSGESGPTRRQAGGRRWRRSSQGLYVPADVDPGPPEQRILEAAARLPAYGGITGWAALRWAGAVWFDGLAGGGKVLMPVTLATGVHDVRGQAGSTVCHEGLPPEHLAQTNGLVTTISARSVSFEARHARSLVEAVVAIDMAAFSDICSIDEVAEFVAGLGTWKGVPQARHAARLAVENSWSPMETRLRMVWILSAGLPAPMCNTPVFDLRGNHVGTPDLLDTTIGLVVEYDGRFHLARAQRHRDVKREERFRDVGLDYATVLGVDFLSPKKLPHQLIRIRDRARRHAHGTPQGWTIERPSWWTATDTVAQRRALAASHRDGRTG